MKIALVRRSCSLRQAGAERYCVNLFRQLQARGHEVTIVGESIDDDLRPEADFLPVRVNHTTSWTKNRSFAEGCKQAGCALIGGETAEMPGMYSDGDYDLAGFAVGAAERGQLLPAGDLAEGDVILGLASSGVHSNGYSLVRKIVGLSGLDYADKAPFNADITLAEALLAPTKIYVKPLLKAIRETGAIKALAHITGGGFPENIPRVLPEGLSAEIDLDAVKAPAVFGWLAQTGGVEPKEMLRTFNCGVGMIVVVSEENATKVTDILTGEGESVVRLGAIGTRDAGAPGVTYKGTLSL